MPAQGRKNVHGKTGVRFKAAYTKSKYENMLRNVVTDLIIHGSIKVTAATAKDVIKEADRLVTLTKKEDVMNAKRQAARFVRNIVADEKSGLTALDKLFNEIGPKIFHYYLSQCQCFVSSVPLSDCGCLDLICR